MNPPPISVSRPITDRNLPVILGGVAAVFTALFIMAHWSFVVFGGLVVLALSVAENETFLLTVIFLLPVSWLLKTDFLIHDVMTAGRAVVVAGFFAGRLWRSQIRGDYLLRSAFSRWSILFGAAALLSVALGTGGWTHNSVRSLAILASSLSFYFFILEWANSRDRIQKILIVLLCSTMVTAVFAIVQEIANGYTSFWLTLNPPSDELADWDRRATSFLNYPNSLAAYLNLLLPFAVACYFRGEGKWKRLGGWATGLGLIGIVCTQSRGGIVAFGFVLVLATFYLVEAWPKRLGFLGAIAVAVWALYLIGVAVNPERLSEGAGVSLGGRLVLWAVAWELFRNSQIFGVGMGNFTGIYGSYIDVSWIRPGFLTVNNLYLEILSEIGIVGFVAFSALIVSGIRCALRHFHSSTDGLGWCLSFGVLGAMSTIVVHGAVDLTLDVNPQFDTLLWVMLGILAADMALQARTLSTGMRQIPGGTR
jgi:putative inorganic carbon (hco3(-)) transporter